MCGRFALGLRHAQIQQLQGYQDQPVGEWVDRDAFVPRYNIAPRTNSPVLRRATPSPEPGSSQQPGPSDSQPQLILHTMKWGLVPHWNKHEDPSAKTTNARAENLLEQGGMWQSMKGAQRCAVLCQGYYEWQKKGKTRVPHFTKMRDGRLMLLAGLYDSVVLQGHTERLWTFTIVTTAACDELSWLHDRQPVILSTKAALDAWLNPNNTSWRAEDSKLVDLVKPYDNSISPLECYKVPMEVGKVGVESPTFIEPVQERKDGIQAMFSRQFQVQSATSKIKGKDKDKTEMKRKRSDDGPSTPIKKTKQEEEDEDIKRAKSFPTPEMSVKEEEGSSDIELLDGPPPTSSTGVGVGAKKEEEDSDVELLGHLPPPPKTPKPKNKVEAKPKGVPDISAFLVKKS